MKYSPGRSFHARYRSVPVGIVAGQAVIAARTTDPGATEYSQVDLLCMVHALPGGWTRDTGGPQTATRKSGTSCHPRFGRRSSNWPEAAGALTAGAWPLYSPISERT